MVCVYRSRQRKDTDASSWLEKQIVVQILFQVGSSSWPYIEVKLWKGEIDCLTELSVTYSAATDINVYGNSESFLLEPVKPIRFKAN